VGIALGYDDAIAAAKGIIGFARKNEKLKPMAAVVEGQLVLAGELKAISELPPRKVLLGIMAGTMAAPLSKMAGALSATVGSFGHALNALLSKKEKTG
jgi:large subunit ribosomal protein L10